MYLLTLNCAHTYVHLQSILLSYDFIVKSVFFFSGLIDKALKYILVYFIALLYMFKNLFNGFFFLLISNLTFYEFQKSNISIYNISQRSNYLSNASIHTYFIATLVSFVSVFISSN